MSALYSFESLTERTRHRIHCFNNIDNVFSKLEDESAIDKINKLFTTIISKEVFFIKERYLNSLQGEQTGKSTDTEQPLFRQEPFYLQREFKDDSLNCYR